MGLFSIDHHHYFHGNAQESDLYAHILQKLNLVISNQNKIMADLQQFETALSRIDTATTNIANQLRDLKDQVANKGLDAETEATILNRLETAATQLEAVGQSVENPVPPDTEEPTQP